MNKKKKKIGEILIENKVITKETLDEALEYQRKFGGSVTQYLLSYGYVDEKNLASCISEQFSLPYLPLSVYRIPKEIIKTVPVDIAEKYWLIPIDKFKNIITVVMADPLDKEATAKVEEVTGCKVQLFVGILTDIRNAIECYYNVVIPRPAPTSQRVAPLFIDKDGYKGFDRRRSVRFNAKIDIHFPVQELYKKSETKNVSTHGLLFESKNMLPLNTYITMQLNLPKKISLSPIAAVGQVVRVIPLENNGFDIGVEFIKISGGDLRLIIQYARTYKR